MSLTLAFPLKERTNVAASTQFGNVQTGNLHYFQKETALTAFHAYTGNLPALQSTAWTLWLSFSVTMHTIHV